MTAPTTIKSIRYQVLDSSGTMLDVFSKKENAVAKAVAFALEFKNDTFYVIKKSLQKEIRILEISINAQFKFADAFDVLSGIESAASGQKKKIHGSYKKDNWRP